MRGREKGKEEERVREGRRERGKDEERGRQGGKERNIKQCTYMYMILYMKGKGREKQHFPRHMCPVAQCVVSVSN